MRPIHPHGSTKVRDGSGPATDYLAHPGAQQIQCAVRFLFFFGGGEVLCCSNHLTWEKECVTFWTPSNDNARVTNLERNYRGDVMYKPAPNHLFKTNVQKRFRPWECSNLAATVQREPNRLGVNLIRILWWIVQLAWLVHVLVGCAGRQMRDEGLNAHIPISP